MTEESVDADSDCDGMQKVDSTDDKEDVVSTTLGDADAQLRELSGSGWTTYDESTMGKSVSHILQDLAGKLTLNDT